MKIRPETRTNRIHSTKRESKAYDQSIGAFKLPPEIEFSGWKFSDVHRRAFKAITEHPDARRAFRQLSTGENAILPSHLLLALGDEVDPLSLGNWKDWDSWKDKWDYLGRTAKRLREIALKVEKLSKANDRGPIPLPTFVGMETDAGEYELSLGSNGRLKSIADQLLGGACMIEQDCQMRQEWLRKLPRKDCRDITEKERLALLMTWVKERTGQPHFEDVATLLNVVRGLSGSSKELSADFLRKLVKRLSTPGIRRMYQSR